MIKKRLGIFAFYNENGIVEDYIPFLLNSIKAVLHQLIVVINGPIQLQGMKELNKLADQIYIRENIGYDGGAYQDILLNYISCLELQEYDELILFNNTFFGPFLPWQHIFSSFERIKTDFWGLSKWIQGPSSMQGYPYLLEHVQAYFLVIRKQILINKCFRTFWEKMPLPMSYNEAIRNFEVAFTTYFKSYGFQYKTWIELMGGDKYLCSGEVIYIKHMGDLVVEYDFPIIKRKAISFVNLEQFYKAFKFIKKAGFYNIKLIENELARLEKIAFPYQEIEEFYYTHHNIYVFGHGKWGHEIESYFKFKNWNIRAFVVTRKESDEEKVLELSDLKIEKEDGLIVALGKKTCKELKPILKEKLKDKDILFPKEDFF